MTDPSRQTSPPPDAVDDDFELPPGNHALEVAARRGLGPLSPLGRKVWHGDARPCVSCGQLVHRDDPACEDCGQDLSEEMLERMLAHAGPWYVAEHVRPFPGVTIERIIRQIRRGVITETSIVRGPETGHQWRFAGETPGLCRYFGRCWHCHEQVEPMDSHCPSCLSDMRFQVETFSVSAPVRPLVAGRPAPAEPTRSTRQSPPPRPAAATPATATATATFAPPATVAAATVSSSPVAAIPSPQELRELAEAVRSTPPTVARGYEEDAPRIAGFSPFWVLAALLVIAIAGLLVVTKMRRDAQSTTVKTPPAATAPHMPATPAGS